MRKICFVSGDIGRSGGTERVCTQIANELVNRGYDVTILSFWKGNPPFFLLDNKVKVYYLVNGKIQAWMKKTYFYAVFKLRSFINQNSIDILIDVDIILGKYSVNAIKGTNCKLVSWEHFNYLNTIKSEERKRILAKVKKHSDKLLVLTKADEKMHLELAGFERDKVYQIYNPTPFKIESTYITSQKVFIAVGRLTYQKGFERLIDIWKIVENQLEDWKLLIIGSGEDEMKLKEKVSDLGLHNIEFISNTKNVEYYYNIASVYLMTSRYEGFPMVLLEAKAKGVPIISFDCPTGPAELVTDDESGYLINEEDYEEFARKLVILARDEEKRKKFSDNCINEIGLCTIKQIGDNWEEFLEQL